jgi:hypothetical protein
MIGPKKVETTGQWRRLHNEELFDLYSPPINFRVIKSRTKGLEGMKHAWGGERCTQGFCRETRGKQITWNSYTYVGG